MKEEPKRSRKGAEKRSRKKAENIRTFQTKPYNDADHAHGCIGFKQEADTKCDKGITGTRHA